jgi:hypothetical protein
VKIFDSSQSVNTPFDRIPDELLGHILNVGSDSNAAEYWPVELSLNSWTRSTFTWKIVPGPMVKLASKVCRRWANVAQPGEHNQHLWHFAITIGALDSRIYVSLIEALEQSKKFDLYVDFQLRGFIESPERDFHSLLFVFWLLRRRSSQMAAVALKDPHANQLTFLLSQLVHFPRIHTVCSLRSDYRDDREIDVGDQEQLVCLESLHGHRALTSSEDPLILPSVTTLSSSETAPRFFVLVSRFPNIIYIRWYDRTGLPSISSSVLFGFLINSPYLRVLKFRATITEVEHQIKEDRNTPLMTSLETLALTTTLSSSITLLTSFAFHDLKTLSLKISPEAPLRRFPPDPLITFLPSLVELNYSAPYRDETLDFFSSFSTPRLEHLSLRFKKGTPSDGERARSLVGPSATRVRLRLYCLERGWTAISVISAFQTFNLEKTTELLVHFPSKDLFSPEDFTLETIHKIGQPFFGRNLKVELHFGGFLGALDQFLVVLHQLGIRSLSHARLRIHGTDSHFTPSFNLPPNHEEACNLTELLWITADRDIRSCNLSEYGVDIVISGTYYSITEWLDDLSRFHQYPQRNHEATRFLLLPYIRSLTIESTKTLKYCSDSSSESSLGSRAFTASVGGRNLRRDSGLKKKLEEAAHWRALVGAPFSRISMNGEIVGHADLGDEDSRAGDFGEADLSEGDSCQEELSEEGSSDNDSATGSWEGESVGSEMPKWRPMSLAEEEVFASIAAEKAEREAAKGTRILFE